MSSVIKMLETRSRPSDTLCDISMTMPVLYCGCRQRSEAHAAL